MTNSNSQSETVKLKTVYCLRVRQSDKEPWSDTEYYRTRAERNNAERVNRVMGGIRCHSFEEKKTAAEIAELFD